MVDGLWVISLEGKTLRGARTGIDGHHTWLLLCAAPPLGSGRWGRQEQRDPVVPDLLGVVDVDGPWSPLMRCTPPHDTARAIQDLGAHYVFTVEADSEHLYAQIKRLSWKHVPAVPWASPDMVALRNTVIGKKGQAM